MMLFSVLSDGEMSLLQGLHEVKRLSKASLVGALVGLVAGVPLYWVFGYGGNSPRHDYPGCGHMGVLPLQHATCITRRDDDNRCAALSLQWAIARRMLSLGGGSDGRNCAHHPRRLSCQHGARALGSVGDVGLFQSGKHYRRGNTWPWCSQPCRSTTFPACRPRYPTMPA